MDRIELSLNTIKKIMNGDELLLTPAGDRDLNEISGRIADMLGTAPPLIVDPGALGSVMEHLTELGERPIAAIWKIDTEELVNELDIVVIEHLPYSNPNHVFGSPTLSLLSRTGHFWKDFPNSVRAYYDIRYRNISEGYLEGLRRGGFQISAHAVGEEIHSLLRQGMGDIYIGVVRNERELPEEGVWPLDRIIGGGIDIVGPKSIWDQTSI